MPLVIGGLRRSRQEPSCLVVEISRSWSEKDMCDYEVPKGRV